MKKVRGIFVLQTAVAVAGVAAFLLAVSAGSRVLSLRAPSSTELLGTCGSFMLPKLDVATVTVLALNGAALSVLLLAGRAAVRQVRAARRLQSTLRVLGPIDDGAATLVADDRPQAFCAGFLHPRVYVSTGALTALQPDELDAVLAHEAHHARHRDPLRIAFARVVAEALFFLPVLGRLADRYIELAEVAADAAAVRRHAGDVQPLAAALQAFEDRPSSPAVGIAPERVDHLLGEPLRWGIPFARLAFAAVVLALLALLALRAGADAGRAVSVPLFAAQMCMVTMTVLPVAVGAGVLLAGGRAAVRFRRHDPHR